MYEVLGLFILFIVGMLVVKGGIWRNFMGASHHANGEEHVFCADADHCGCGPVEVSEETAGAARET